MYHDHFEGWQRPRRGRSLFALTLVALIAAPIGVEFVYPDVYPEGKGPISLVSQALAPYKIAATKADLAVIPEVEEEVTAIESAIGAEISPELADSIRMIQAEQLMDPAVSKSVEAPDTMERLQQIYSSINPVEISIPSSIPDLAKIITVADALNPEITGDITESPVMRYALGEDGISPEMEAAFKTVKKAKEGEIFGLTDEEVSDLARNKIGYVPNGVDPAAVDAPTGVKAENSRSSAEGTASVVSAHQIMIGEMMIRLEGVRAPSYNEICTNAAGAEYDCVSWSIEGMKYFIGDKPVTCAVSDIEHEEGGMLGRCIIDMNDVQTDLARVAIRAGVLIADETVEGEAASPYISEMEIAKNNKAGLWSGALAGRNQEAAADGADASLDEEAATTMDDELASDELSE